MQNASTDVTNKRNNESSSSDNGWLDTLQKLPKDSIPKTFIVAFVVSLFGGILVSTTAVLLKPFHLANKEREQQQYLLAIIERHPGIQALFDVVEAHHVEAQVVDLAAGQYIQTIDPNEYDQRKAAQDPNQSIAIPPRHDIAKIKRRAKYATVYLVRKNDVIKSIVLPIYGKGYASTLYGYLGLDASANTVIGLNFYEHSETPGLGAQVNDPAWLAQWRGKKLRDLDGKLRIGVARGQVEAESPDVAYKVDGLSGATWTSRGVHHLVRFWLGDYGFGPYLRNLPLLQDQ